MAYAPNKFSSTVPLPGNDDFIDGSGGIAANHNQVYVTHQPPVAEFARDLSLAGAVSRDWLRFRHRGNMDAQTLTARVRASNGGAGSPTLGFRVDSAAAVSSGAVGADAWYTMDASPSAASVHDCVITATVAGGVTLNLTRLNCYLSPAAAAGAKRRSGWIYQNAVNYGANYATTVEHLERWSNGPVQIAKDRPHCVLSHLSDIKTGSPGKSRVGWSTTNVDYYDEVGRAIVPRCSDVSRRFIIDAYLARPSGTGVIAGALRVGGTTFDVTVIDGWSTFEAVLPPGPLEVSAMITCAAATSAQFDCVQIWRA